MLPRPLSLHRTVMFSLPFPVLLNGAPWPLSLADPTIFIILGTPCRNQDFPKGTIYIRPQPATSTQPVILSAPVDESIQSQIRMRFTMPSTILVPVPPEHSLQVADLVDFDFRPHYNMQFSFSESCSHESQNCRGSLCYRETSDLH